MGAKTGGNNGITRLHLGHINNNKTEVTSVKLVVFKWKMLFDIMT